MISEDHIILTMRRSVNY